MTKNVESFSKAVKVELTKEEINAAIIKAAGAGKASDAKVEFDMDGAATVSYTIVKTAK